MYISYIVGSYDYFMQKEIFEQPESIMNTMRGRVKFGDYSGKSLKPEHTWPVSILSLTVLNYLQLYLVE